MKVLVVFYSRTGSTKKVADELKNQLEADIDEITEPIGRGGPIGWIKSGRDASRRTIVEINKPKVDPSTYDLVVVGSPVWSWTLSSPVRSYLSLMREKLPRVAFFCTEDGNIGDTFKVMEELAGKPPVASSMIQNKEVKSGLYRERIKAFSEELRRLSEP
jgi:menaquinone-dependent protoporphyrinogen IX oxidase